MNFIAFSLPPGLFLITASAPEESSPWSRGNHLPARVLPSSEARVGQIETIEASPLSAGCWLSAPPPQWRPACGLNAAILSCAR